MSCNKKPLEKSYLFSKDKIELSVEQLKTNLKTLVTRAAAMPPAPDNYLVGNRVSHQFIVKNEDGDTFARYLHEINTILFHFQRAFQ